MDRCRAEKEEEFVDVLGLKTWEQLGPYEGRAEERDMMHEHISCQKKRKDGGHKFLLLGKKCDLYVEGGGWLVQTYNEDLDTK